MPIAVRTNVAFDSRSSRLVRKKAARTEAGVVVLESPAIVQERLAPHGSRAILHGHLRWLLNERTATSHFAE